MGKRLIVSLCGLVHCGKWPVAVCQPVFDFTSCTLSLLKYCFWTRWRSMLCKPIQIGT